VAQPITGASRHVCGKSHGLHCRPVLSGWLDRVLYRHPFEGASARRYEALEQPAFGDLDDRLLDELARPLATARVLCDVGAGPGTFAARAARRHAGLHVLAVDPSRDFARPSADVIVVRAWGEALPLADRSVDVATCLSSIRHVRDRLATLRELRRVVRPGGCAWIVELDPAASTERIAAHATRLGSTLLRRAFGPLVVRTAPTATQIEGLAIEAGWTRTALRNDAAQPVYIMELA
jgi:ubiquinone/menaquinone biosynthesis C-methylase UbiE